MRQLICRVLCYTGFGVAVLATKMRSGTTSALFCLATFLIVTAIVEVVMGEVIGARENK